MIQSERERYADAQIARRDLLPLKYLWRKTISDELIRNWFQSNTLNHLLEKYLRKHLLEKYLRKAWTYF